MIQVRAVFALSEWRGFPVARGHYETARRSTDSEKQHIIPGNRFLPNPGSRINEEESARLLARAWVLNRLDWANDRGWTVLPAAKGDPPLAIGPGGAPTPQSAYRMAVDLVSATSCFVRAHGPGGLRLRLSELNAALANGSSVCGLKTLPPGVIPAAIQGLHAEADWWERNTHPASNGWQEAK
jgi:hypothetical protein